MTDLREIDRKVAEHVMGWIRVKNSVGSHLIDSAHIVMDERRELYGTGSVPRYSTDIAAAWSVVEKMGNVTFDILKLQADEEYVCEFVLAGNKISCSSSKSAPLAICKAALAARGVEI